MKIDLSKIDREQLQVQEKLLFEEKVYLVTPQRIGVKWTQENKIFRSSLWDSEGNLISAGFPKFANWGENPENFPVPETLDDCELVEKIDGSLLIISKWKGRVIVRTRGTIDATQLETGTELELLKEKYPDVFDTCAYRHCSMLYEWVSPNNQIVIRHKEPELYFIGAVHHDDYRLARQKDLDYSAGILGVSRPSIFQFGTIDEMLTAVQNMSGHEGIVVYSQKGQVLHKVKSVEYLLAHKVRYELRSPLRIWEAVSEGKFNEILALLPEDCRDDFEGFGSVLLQRFAVVEEEAKSLFNTIQHLHDRREFARYATCFKVPAALFAMLDGKNYERHIWRYLKP